MKIRINDPSLVDELVHHLRRSGCEAEAADVQAHGDGAMVEVGVPGALDDEQARMEIELYVRVWEATHPGVAADLLA